MDKGLYDMAGLFVSWLVCGRHRISSVVLRRAEYGGVAVGGRWACLYSTNWRHLARPLQTLSTRGVHLRISPQQSHNAVTAYMASIVPTLAERLLFAGIVIVSRSPSGDLP